jgi:hypothetical protein
MIIDGPRKITSYFYAALKTVSVICGVFVFISLMRSEYPVICLLNALGDRASDGTRNAFDKRKAFTL